MGCSTTWTTFSMTKTRKKSWKVGNQQKFRQEGRLKKQFGGSCEELLMNLKILLVT